MAKPKNLIMGVVMIRGKLECQGIRRYGLSEPEIRLAMDAFEAGKAFAEWHSNPINRLRKLLWAFRSARVQLK